MKGKIAKNGYKITNHGSGCLEIEDRGFSVLVNPYSGLDAISSANIVFSADSEVLADLENVGGSSRFCAVFPDNGLEIADGFDFELVEDDSTVDIFGVKVSYKDLGEGGFRLIVEMADMTFCIVSSETVLNGSPEISSHLIDFLLLPLDEEKGMDIKQAVKSSVAVKPNTVAAYSINSVEESKIRSFKAEIEDRNIEMRRF